MRKRRRKRKKKKQQQKQLHLAGIGTTIPRPSTPQHGDCSTALAEVLI